MRLDKFLSEASVERRKAVRTFIKDGKIKVNGEIAAIPAMEIDEKRDIIEYLGEVVTYKENIYYMFHKPSGCVTARSDERDKTVFDYFQEVDCKGLFPVGRLDKDTEGLLFITNDGEFNHQLMYPDKHVDKKYFFWAFGTLTEQQIQTLKNGISIREEEPLTKPSKVEIIKEGMFSELKGEIQGSKHEKVKKNKGEQPVLAGYITISEGRKHQIKRMLKACGCYVIYLKRISIGKIDLDEKLEKGQHRQLTKAELESIYKNARVKI